MASPEPIILNGQHRRRARRRAREGHDLEETAGLIAAIATTIAAMMTASNMGARVTGWGFVVFTLGSICWSIVRLSSGQTSLVATNIFLTFVNLIGIWRWLGRQRIYDDGARSASVESRRPGTPTLFPATGLAGMPVSDLNGADIGHAIEAMIECHSGRISYIVIATGGFGGIDEELRSIPIGDVDCHADGLIIHETRAMFARRNRLIPGQWPGRGPASGPSASGRDTAIDDQETVHATA